jgi:small subunit ribosomal protein S16
MGRKKQPHYRVVVADGAAPRDGRVVENLGYYKPRSTPARLVLDLERFDYWVNQGAEPSETVRSLASKARRGGTQNVAMGEMDLEVQKKRESDALAARRTAERKDREGRSDGKGRVEPQDTGKGEPAASSATDATAAEAMADGAARAIEDAEDDAPESNAPDGSMAKQAAAKSRRGGKTKGSGAEGASGNE